MKKRKRMKKGKRLDEFVRKPTAPPGKPHTTRQGARGYDRRRDKKQAERRARQET